MNIMLRQARYIGVLGLWLCAAVAFAAPTQPKELVEQTANDVIAKLKKERTQIDKNPQLLYPFIEKYVLPHFDFERMAKWVLGRSWRDASGEQQQRFVVEFRQLLVRTYASSLMEYSDRNIRYLPFHAEANAVEVTVRSEVEQPGGFPIPISYELYLKDDRWMVYDVAIDNQSLISNYRNTFAREIKQGSIDQLIKKLAERNKQSKT
ncbi:MAG: ABC transporter substrate-binding protein [Gammaproteobacteria bacterium]|nr:ABC transporter substrate-binding protein [Gammaproteobacteria bacterium]